MSAVSAHVQVHEGAPLFFNGGGGLLRDDKIFVFLAQLQSAIHWPKDCSRRFSHLLEGGDGVLGRIKNTSDASIPAAFKTTAVVRF